MRRYRVTVGGDELHFASAHFITYENGDCERLHGHNYRVSVAVEGPLNEAGYVFDFLELKSRTTELLDRLDHRLLLPDRNPRLRVEAGEDEVRARCGARRYAFPASDVRILPVANTTAEAVASWLVDALREALEVREADGGADGDGGGARDGTGAGAALTRLEVTLEESPGQEATCVWAADGEPGPPS